MLDMLFNFSYTSSIIFRFQWEHTSLYQVSLKGVEYA
jgi:hypothetical protein